MNNPQIQPIHIQPVHLDEEILVVQRSQLLKLNNNTLWHGINKEMFQACTAIISTHAAFIPRSRAETNPAYKQIIPYLIFSHSEKIFVMQRKTTSSEQRLAQKFSIGIGGHIRQEDITSNNIFTWAQREFNEEINYNGKKKVTNLGILNDDSNDVGKVHLGIVLHITGDNDQISIKDEHKSGILLSLDECMALYDQMEPWSQICLQFLIQEKLF